jgi:hypothetical protein
MMHAGTPWTSANGQPAVELQQHLLFSGVAAIVANLVASTGLICLLAKLRANDHSDEHKLSMSWRAATPALTGDALN